MTGQQTPKAKPEKRIRAITSTPRTLIQTMKDIKVKPEWQDLVIASCAKNGDFGPLTDALELGDEIGPLTRAFLVEDFASGLPRKRGNKATIEQKQRDMTIILQVAFAMTDHQIEKSKAINLVAKKLDKPRSTIQSIVERTEPDFREYMPQKIDGRFVMPYEIAENRG